MVNFEEVVVSSGNRRATNDERSSYRIRSFDFISTSGDFNAVQIKPNVSVGGTTGITGLEVSPRFADGKAGNNCIAIKADPALKGTSGDLTGQVVGVQSNIDLGSDTSTRTIGDDVAAFEAFLSLPSQITVDGLTTVVRVRSVNIAKWDAFLNLDDANTGCTQGSAAGSTGTYFLKVYIGATLHTIALLTA